MKKSRVAILIFFLLAVLDIFIWHGIIFAGRMRAGDYFLDVGQGDSELVVFPDGVKILTDAGPGNAVMASLEKVLPPDDRYIDLAVISHPQSDHYGGFTDILDHDDIGAFIWNGRDDDSSVASWWALKDKIAAKHVPVVVLGAGDKIISGAGEDDILSPDSVAVMSAELNDTGFVERLTASGFTTLLTADTGFSIENYLVSSLPSPRGGEGSRSDSWEGLSSSSDFLHADVLKVGHHGSKYASGDAFLRAVNPKVAVIEVGASNTYGQPASSTLARITSSTNAQIFRTDQNGTIEVFKEGGKLVVKTEK